MWTQFSLFFSLYISGDLLSIWSFWVFTQWKCSRPACYSFDTVLFSFSYWRVTFFWHVEKGNILKGSFSFSRKYKNERHSFILVWLNQFQYKKRLIWFRICGNTSVAWYILRNVLATWWPLPNNCLTIPRDNQKLIRGNDYNTTKKQDRWYSDPKARNG